MFVIILIFAALLSILCGYTMVIQGTTLALGRILIGPAFARGTGLQDAITPKMQNTRNIFVVTLFVLLFFLTTYAYAWYHAIWVIIIAFFASSIFPVILDMRAGSNRIVSIILQDMKKREKVCLESSDKIKATAISDLIKRIEEISQETILNEVKR